MAQLIQYLLILVVYIFLGCAGLMLAHVPSVSVIWPASGFAVAASYCVRQCWPVLFLGAFIVNTIHGTACVTNLAIAIGNTLEYVVAAFLLHNLSGFDIGLLRARDVCQFLIFGAAIPAMIAARIGTFALMWQGVLPAELVPRAWYEYWQGDALGILLLTPPLIIWQHRR